MRTRRLLAAAALIVSAVLVTAASTAGEEPALAPAAQSWVGWVQRHADHFDYSGTPCSEQSGDFCTANMVEYRIVPATPAVDADLAAREGQRTRLWGTLDRTPDESHQGVLTVERVEPAP